jgi:hypothetical protein
MKNAFRVLADPFLPAKARPTAMSKQTLIGTRLEILSRDLAQRLKESPTNKQREAGLAAYEFAVSHASLEYPLVHDALAKLRNRESLASDEEAAIDALFKRVDEESLALGEAVESGQSTRDDYDAAFARARAMAAVSFASGTDPFLSSAEAIYEASFTAEDKNELLGLIESLLR